MTYLRDKRFLFYNSKFSRMRILDLKNRKILIKMRLEDEDRNSKNEDESKILDSCVENYVIDPLKGDVFYSFSNEEEIGIFNFFLRRKIGELKFFEGYPNLRERCNFNQIFSEKI